MGVAYQRKNGFLLSKMPKARYLANFNEKVQASNDHQAVSH